MSKELPWTSISNLLVKAGKHDNAWDFVLTLLDGLRPLIDYSEGMALALNRKSEIILSHLDGSYARWNPDLLSYYLNNQPFLSEDHKNFWLSAETKEIQIINWATSEYTNLLRPFVLQRDCQSSLTFFFDCNPFKVILSLDRFDGEFNTYDYRIAQALYPLANTIFQILAANRTLDSLNEIKLQGNLYYKNLTKREREIASLLVRGVNVATISKDLNISPSTTYKHMANIYKKYHVNSLQAFLTKARLEN